MGLDKYPENKSDKYDSVELKAKVIILIIYSSFEKKNSSHFLKELLETHKKAQVGGPFKSGKFQKVFFDKNPFLSEKDGATYKDIKRSKSESTIKPFKYTSPPKTVNEI